MTDLIKTYSEYFTLKDAKYKLNKPLTIEKGKDFNLSDTILIENTNATLTVIGSINLLREVAIVVKVINGITVNATGIIVTGNEAIISISDNGTINIPSSGKINGKIVIFDSNTFRVDDHISYSKNISGTIINLSNVFFKVTKPIDVAFTVNLANAVAIDKNVAINIKEGGSFVISENFGIVGPGTINIINQPTFYKSDVIRGLGVCTAKCIFVVTTKIDVNTPITLNEDVRIEKNGRINIFPKGKISGSVNISGDGNINIINSLPFTSTNGIATNVNVTDGIIQYEVRQSTPINFLVSDKTIVISENGSITINGAGTIKNSTIIIVDSTTFNITTHVLGITASNFVMVDKVFQVTKQCQISTDLAINDTVDILENGTIEILDGVKIANNGIINVYGKIVSFGIVDNVKSINIDGGCIQVQGGTFTTNGSIVVKGLNGEFNLMSGSSFLTTVDVTGGSVTVEDGCYINVAGDSNSRSFNVKGGNIIIKQGGEIDVVSKIAVNSGSVTIDGKMICKGKIDVSGGTFTTNGKFTDNRAESKINVSGGTFTVNATNSEINGLINVSGSGFFINQKDLKINCMEISDGKLLNAGTLTLTNNSQIMSGKKINYNYINISGGKITTSSGTTTLADMKLFGEVNVSGNVTIQGYDSQYSQLYVSKNMFNVNGMLSLERCLIEIDGGILDVKSFGKITLNTYDSELRMSAKISKANGGQIIKRLFASIEPISQTDGVDSSCFPFDSTVTTPQGKKRCGDLIVGDYVLVDHQGTYEPILFFGHREKNKETLFTELKLANGKKMSATPQHYIFVYNKTKTMVHIKDVVIGDYVKYNGKRVKVTETNFVTKCGFISPHTKSHEIVVNGVQASCYATEEFITINNIAVNMVDALGITIPLSASNILSRNIDKIF